MSNLGMYLVRTTDYCAETRNLIEDVINSIVHNLPFMNTELKTLMLKEALKSMGFSDEQLTAFAKDELPTEYQIVPVNVGIERQYRTYVRVPLDAAPEQIEKATVKQILENGDACLTPDLDLDIEEGDIRWKEIDWDGVECE